MNDLSAILPLPATLAATPLDIAPAPFQSLFDAASAGPVQPAVGAEPPILIESHVEQPALADLDLANGHSENLSPTLHWRPAAKPAAELRQNDGPHDVAEEPVNADPAFALGINPAVTGSPAPLSVPQMPISALAIQSTDKALPHHADAQPLATIARATSAGQQMTKPELARKSPEASEIRTAEPFAKTSPNTASPPARPDNAPANPATAPKLPITDNIVQIQASLLQPATHVASPAAPAEVTTAQAPLLNLIEDMGWIDTLARDIAASASGDGRLSFRLMPEFLGTLDISVTRNADAVDIQMQAATETAARLISAEQPRLVEELRQSGTKTGDFQMATGQQGNAPRQQPSPSPAQTPPPTRQPTAARNGRFA